MVIFILYRRDKDVKSKTIIQREENNYNSLSLIGGQKTKGESFTNLDVMSY